MKNLKNTIIQTGETLIEMTNASVESTDFDAGILTFTLALDGQNHGEYSVVLSDDFHISDVYLDCNKHLPEPEDEEFIDSLQNYAEAVKALYDASETGQAELTGHTLYVQADIIEEQKSWGESDLAKNTSFLSAPFWLLSFPDGITPMSWDDIPELMEAI